MVSLVAASLPDGAEVVVPEGDFTSVVFPFLVHADRGVRVRQVPLAGLADAIGPATTAVAFSLAQSANGVVADADAVREAAARHGVLTLCDLTQAAGWMPSDASRFDVTTCSAYKWLCHPRGTAYLTVRPEVMDRLRPLAGRLVRRGVAVGLLLRAGHAAGRGRPPVRRLPGLAVLGRLRCRRWSCSRRSTPSRCGPTTPGWPTPCWPGSGSNPRAAPWSRCRIPRERWPLPSPSGERSSPAGPAGCGSRFHLWNDEADVELAADCAGVHGTHSERPVTRRHTHPMQEDEATRIAEALRGYGLIAHVARPSAYRFGIRVPLGDGREALWDVDGAAGLEAQIMRDGVLVGFVPQHRGVGEFDEAMTARAIATADYGTAP